MKKLLTVLFLLFVFTGVTTNAFAIYVEGGDATSQDAADDILDIVFVFDTSGSMGDEINALVPKMQDIVSNIDCPDCDVWVRATLMGINSSGRGLGENVVNYTINAGGTPVSNHSEDNAPAVQDMANWYNWNDDSDADQDYFKAIVTIGDEGTEGGHPINADDWAAADAANQAAIDEDVMVFSVLGTPYYTRPADVQARDAVFTALAVGGSGYGYTLADTGGTVTHTTDNTIEADIEAIICTAAGGGTGGGGPDPIPEPTTMLLLGAGLTGIIGAKRKKLLKK